MVDYKTLRVPEEAYEHAKEAKKDDETWGEYLRRCSENPPEIKRFVEADASNTDELVSQLEDSLEGLSEGPPGGVYDQDELLKQIEKAQELAEQARDNTEELKQGLGR